MQQSARGIFVGICFLALALSGPLGPAASAQTGDQTADAIRKAYAPLLEEYSRIFMGSGTPDCIGFALKKDMVSAELKALLLKEQGARKKSRGVGKLDFDLFFNAQDDSGKPLSIVGVVRDGEAYAMTVSNGFKGAAPHQLVLVRESGRWVIDDARYRVEGKAFTLKGLLK